MTLTVLAQMSGSSAALATSMEEAVAAIARVNDDLTQTEAGPQNFTPRRTGTGIYPP
ncbi:hypothetical protein [Neomoorella mulderi]|uniref:Uncharacterized protein n=1 Tax=Moorella mulderi DSM 14980 TaxID=1122241 RepID=A0A151ANA5_9FIRM|nr:hypothetical protein [Moorella mulderi]KYH28897.1 hypothetical protein MOMUL_30900 [Moorella mulderi DSM 14980]